MYLFGLFLVKIIHRYKTVPTNIDRKIDGWYEKKYNPIL